MSGKTSEASDQEKLTGKGFYPWYVLGVLVLVNIFSWLDRQIIVMLIEPIRSDLGISDVQIGLLTGFAFALLYAVCGIPLGWAADRYSRRIIIFIGMCLWSVATASCGLARNFWQLFLARVGIGVGEAAFLPSAFSIMGDTFPPQRMALASAFMNCANGIGIGLSFTIAGIIAASVSHGETTTLPFLGEFRSWQVPFIIVGLPGVLVALLLFTIREPKRRGLISTSAGADAPGIGRYLRDHWKFYTSHFAAMTIVNMGTVGMFNWGPVYIMRVFEWSPAQVGPIYGAFLSVSVISGQMIGGLVVDHFYSRGMKDAHLRIYAIMALVALPISVGSILAHDPWIFIVGIAISNACIMGCTGAGFAALQILTPNEFRGRVVGLFALVATLGGAGLSPLLVAMLTQYVFKDDMAVGFSLAVLYASIYPIAFFLFRKGADEMRKIHLERGI